MAYLFTKIALSYAYAPGTNTNIIWLYPCNLDSMIFEIVPLLYSCLLSVIAFYLSPHWNVASWLSLMIFLALLYLWKVFKSMESFVRCYITVGCIMLLILSRRILQLFPAFHSCSLCHTWHVWCCTYTLTCVPADVVNISLFTTQITKNVRVIFCGVETKQRQ